MARKLLLSGLFFGLVLVGVDRFNQVSSARIADQAALYDGTPMPYPFPAR